MQDGTATIRTHSSHSGQKFTAHFKFAMPTVFLDIGNLELTDLNPRSKATVFMVHGICSKKGDMWYPDFVCHIYLALSLSLDIFMYLWVQYILYNWKNTDAIVNCKFKCKDTYIITILQNQNGALVRVDLLVTTCGIFAATPSLCSTAARTPFFRWKWWVVNPGSHPNALGTCHLTRWFG